LLEVLDATNRSSVSTRLRPVVAIDGPAGAGKSTVARQVAERLGFILVDTGALYRALAWAARRAKVAWSDGPRLGELAQKIVANEELVLPTRLQAVATAVPGYTPPPMSQGRVTLAGEDVTAAIRAPEIGMGASQVSAHAEVRAALLDLQRQLGREGGVVLEGRDIGTVVFPDAEVKFFLTARDEVRAKRRWDELVAKGESVSFEATLEEVRKRDDNDTNRALAPLRQASDAVLVDSSDISIEDTVAFMVEKVAAARSRT
jgi:cytidylate kinase